jgi:hypothetical protein
MPSLNKKNLLLDMKFPLFRKTLKGIGHWQIPSGIDLVASKEVTEKILSEIADEDIFGSQELESSIIHGLKNSEQFDFAGNQEYQIDNEKSVDMWVRSAQAYWMELSQINARGIGKTI